jgi:hypothetical protein
MCCCAFAFLALALLPMAKADGAPPTLDGDILPLLKARCVKCHGPIKHEARLILSSAGSLAAGGESGLAIDRAAPMESLLWQRIESNEMPPDDPLNSQERALLRQWLAAGAIGLPSEAASAATIEHWAFQRIVSPRVPDVNASNGGLTAIDRFLQAAANARGLALSPEADRYTLIRRLSFDLTGLPPSPEDVEAFINDTQADAYERLVERYLASPHYGERWGRHWLDVAGYADSNGYFNADSDRPLAYRYRDYVVASINEDKPFDQFIREQLAGDELTSYHAGEAIGRDQLEALLATHFLRNSQDGTGESDGNADEVRADRYSVLEGTQQILGSALLGLTLQCARCHDHKFEPVTQADYYALQAILAPAFDPENWIKPNDRQAVMAPAAGANSQNPPTDSSEKAAVVFDRSPTPADWFLLVRGNYAQRGEKVAPGVPDVLEEPDNQYTIIAPPGVAGTGRRLALAHWLTQPNSRAAALLARVTVNRVWQRHFGTGICETPDNLGYSGAPPSHPELLEFLAGELMRRGWSLKTLHRTIIQSRTYRQSSQPRDDGLRLDPANRLLWRFPLRRLDAESARDAALAMAGELDSSLGGSYVPTDRNAQGEVIVDEAKPGSRRRSLYLQQRRTQMLSLLEVFDAPSIVTNCTRRSSATIPLQSLSSLNSSFALARARGLAERLSSGPPGEVVTRAFVLVAGRPPNAAEQAACERFLATQPDEYSNRPDAGRQALVDFCQMLLASNAFLYVE